MRRTKTFHCNCCGTNFPEPESMFEKLRCPKCDAVREDDDDEVIEELDEEEE